MRVYYFTTKEFGLLALQNRRLKIARINELNDPFELLSWNVQDPVLRTKLKTWKAARHEEFGIVCFSRTWSNPLLWGHYADKHRGIALGFDVPESDLFSAVKYRQRRLPFPSGRDLNGDDVEDLLLTKFAAWRYESEHRCICRLADSVRDGTLYFEPFSDTLRLAQVIVGDAASISRAEIANSLGEHAAGVETFKARPAFGSFRVVENRNPHLWV